ncbi:UPF0705 protein C11orf49 homolog [Coregonus clupeaformis]|uniref:UPF0705 protein C11orf49 homolog n=1 Tax=Coregonus clupeaformis TaxID=59861 RepID=UPI001E1C6FAC|nr:UPF0705 protein C11orf49 homolog [Coregonus clupeaformis]
MTLLQKSSSSIEVDGVPRYATPLLRRVNDATLHSPKEVVLPSLRSTERRLSNDSKCTEVYCQKIKKLQTTGYVSLVPPEFDHVAGKVSLFLVFCFSSVKNGNHVLFREFIYIKATAHNRASFIRVLWRCIRQIGKKEDFLAMLEYSSLLQLLCPDIQVEMVQHAARIVLMDDAMDCLMFSHFLYSFQIQFYFEEFLEIIAVIYQDLLSGKSPNTVIIPTSTSTQEGVGSSVFGECFEGRCERFKHKMGVGCLSDVHNCVLSLLGALPKKSELLIDPEMDQEVDKLSKLEHRTYLI